MTKKRTGVFVCHCGTNIAATVDVAKVAKEMVREECSWFHSEKAKGTEKAIKISRSIGRRVNPTNPLDAIAVSVTRRAMVIGGGIAGIQAALDIANAGIEVIMVEKQATIGGRMLQLSETFPTLDCSQCVLSPKMVEVKRHPKVKLMTYSEVQEVAGSVGNFRVKVLKKPTYVDPDKCKICDHCTESCPQVVPNEYELNLTARRAIYIPYAHALRASFTLDIDACLGLNPVVCGKCKDVCEADAINYDMRPETVTEDVGAIVVATGFDLYDQA